MAGDGAFIIKHIKKRGWEGHHGGAWKVADADFAQGIDSDRIFGVSGKAGSAARHPSASSNRRISILLMREAPAVPPGYKL
jgi:flagellar motor protein MotB